jgi:sirohydrochlorin cobaltochelatase
MDRNHLPLWAEILLEDRRLAPRRVGGKKHRDEALNSPAFSATRANVATKSCLVLMAHGSKDPRWRGTFECLYESVRMNFGEGIRLAYMEFVGPTLMDVAKECFAEGVLSLRVLPLFMAGGAHVATDIPEQMAQVREAFPGMAVEAMSPIGEDPRMFAVIMEIIGEHARRGNESNFTAA